MCVCTKAGVTPVCDKLSPPSSGLRDPANILINVVFPVPVDTQVVEIVNSAAVYHLSMS